MATSAVVSRLLDRLTDAVERAEALDPVADAIHRVASRVPAGAVKDALSGVAVAHPLHPALVAVPIGALTGAVALDVAGEDSAARRLVGLGLLSSMPAALAGLVDWSDTSGGERRVGVVHLGLNAAGLGLIAASWLARRPGAQGGRLRTGRWLTLGGLGVLGASGWLGGHLSYAIGVGVDTTAFQRPPTTWTDAVADHDLVEGAPLVVTVADLPVLLVRSEGRVHALGNRCTHRGGPLNEGALGDGCVECPWHGSRFDLTDGSVVRGPATRPAPLLETRIRDGRVQVRRSEPRALRRNVVT